MKFSTFFVFSIMTVCAFAAPPHHSNDVYISRLENSHRRDNSYTFVYNLSDGQLRGESGLTKPVGKEEPIVVAGSYSYVAPNGQTYWVNYTADEFGYHPTAGFGEGGPTSSQDFGLDTNAIKSLIG